MQLSHYVQQPLKSLPCILQVIRICSMAISIGYLQGLHSAYNKVSCPHSTLSCAWLTSFAL